MIVLGVLLAAVGGFFAYEYDSSYGVQSKSAAKTPLAGDAVRILFVPQLEIGVPIVDGTSKTVARRLGHLLQAHGFQQVDVRAAYTPKGIAAAKTNEQRLRKLGAFAGTASSWPRLEDARADSVAQGANRIELTVVSYVEKARSPLLVSEQLKIEVWSGSGNKIWEANANYAVKSLDLKYLFGPPQPTEGEPVSKVGFLADKILAQMLEEGVIRA